MKAFLYYLLYPLIFAVASLPFPALYALSDLFYRGLYLSGYRRKVVTQNLRNSFPEKSDAEIEVIVKDYYRYLCDLILESFKGLRMTKEEALERCTFHNTPYLDRLYAEKRSFIILMGHYGNWEWAGPAFTLNTKFQLVVIYRPLSNPYFENLMTAIRTRFGTRIATVNQTLRAMVADRSQRLLTATAFIADQTAPRDQAYWTEFLHQDTAVFTGAEKLAVKFNYPVVYICINRIRRGYYEVIPELLIDAPKETREGEISEAFTRRLEKDIVTNPATWLWSHRRWKHKRLPVPRN